MPVSSTPVCPTGPSCSARRTFLAQVVAGAAGGLAARTLAANAPESSPRPAAGAWLRAARQHRKFDAHAHVGFGPVDQLLRTADHLGIERLCVSRPFGSSPDAFRAGNDLVLQAVRAQPDRLVGQAFVDPRFAQEALEEVKRCLGEGLAGLGELYTVAKVNDPLYFPIIEYCIGQRAPMLWHARADLGLRDARYATAAPPGTSIADDFVDAARRYPEAILIHGHIGGGGDWEYMCKALQNSPSVFLDTSGSVSEPGMIDFAVATLGADRLLFASDMNFETAVGKMLAARLDDTQRHRIFWDNFNEILRKRGLHAN